MHTLRPRTTTRISTIGAVTAVAAQSAKIDHQVPVTTRVVQVEPACQQRLLVLEDRTLSPSRLQRTEHGKHQQYTTEKRDALCITVVGKSTRREGWKIQ